MHRPTSIFRVHQVDLRAIGFLEFISHAVQSRQIVSQQIFLGKSHQHQLRRINDVSTDIHVLFRPVLFCSLAVLGWPHHGRKYFLYLSLCSVILIDSSTESPVHVLMLSIQAVRGLPRLRAPGNITCIISFSRQLPSTCSTPV